MAPAACGGAIIDRKPRGVQPRPDAAQPPPQLTRPIESGTFSTLHGWLLDNIYRHGRKHRPDELVQRATGAPMRMEPYLAYLRGKYGELYSLPAHKRREAAA